VDVRVHRLEPVGDSQAVLAAGDRQALIAGDDRGSVPREGLEVAAAPGAVGMSFKPVERVPGRLEGQVVSRHGPQLAGRVNHERDPVDVLLVAEPCIDIPVMALGHPASRPTAEASKRLLKNGLLAIADEIRYAVDGGFP